MWSWRIKINGKENVINGRWGIAIFFDFGSRRDARCRGGGVLCCDVNLVAVFFGFVIISKLEDIYLEGLLVLTHFTENDGSGFIEIGVCAIRIVLLQYEVTYRQWEVLCEHGVGCNMDYFLKMFQTSPYTALFPVHWQIPRSLV
jgi:hypothetical protein